MTDQQQDLATLRRFLQLIDRDAVEVLRLRFGLGGHEPLTLDQTASRLGIPPARVYELYHGAITDLRAVMPNPRRDHVE